MKDNHMPVRENWRNVMISAFRIISLLSSLRASGALKENITELGSEVDGNNLVSIAVTTCHLSPAFHRYIIVIKLRSEIQKRSNCEKVCLNCITVHAVGKA